MTHNSYWERNTGEAALWAAPPSVHILVSMNATVQTGGFNSNLAVQVGDAPIISFFVCLLSSICDSRELERGALSTTSPSALCLALYCWCDWDTYKEGGGRGWGEGSRRWRDRMSGEKYKKQWAPFWGDQFFFSAAPPPVFQSRRSIRSSKIYLPFVCLVKNPPLN